MDVREGLVESVPVSWSLLSGLVEEGLVELCFRSFIPRLSLIVRRSLRNSEMDWKAGELYLLCDGWTTLLGMECLLILF